MRRLARTAVTLSTVLFAGSVTTLAAGCGSDATSPQQQVAGRYTLRTVNGQSLPYRLDQDDDGTTYDILSEALTLRSDGSLTDETSERVTRPSGAATVVNATSQGTWTLSGATVTMTISGEEVLSGTTSGGNTITIAESGFSAVFQK